MVLPLAIRAPLGSKFPILPWQYAKSPPNMALALAIRAWRPPRVVILPRQYLKLLPNMALPLAIRAPLKIKPHPLSASGGGQATIPDRGGVLRGGQATILDSVENSHHKLHCRTQSAHGGPKSSSYHHENTESCPETWHYLSQSDHPCNKKITHSRHPEGVRPPSSIGVAQIGGGRADRNPLHYNGVSSPLGPESS